MECSKVHVVNYLNTITTIDLVSQLVSQCKGVWYCSKEVRSAVGTRL